MMHSFMIAAGWIMSGMIRLLFIIGKFAFSVKEMPDADMGAAAIGGGKYS